MKQLTMFAMVTWLDTSTVMGICMSYDYNVQKVSIHYIATSAFKRDQCLYEKGTECYILEGAEYLQGPVITLFATLWHVSRKRFCELVFAWT